MVGPPGPKSYLQLDHIARPLSGVAEWLGVTQDGVTYNVSSRELVNLHKFYVDIREYMPGWGDKITDWGPSCQAYINDVYNAGQKPILYLPPVDVEGGFFTLWDSEIFLEFPSSKLPYGLEIMGSGRTRFTMGPNMGGTTDSKIGFHINEGPGSKTSTAAGWEAGTTGIQTAEPPPDITSPLTLVTFRDIFVDTPPSGYPAIRPTVIVANGTRVRLNNVVTNRLQYGLLTVNYSDNSFIEDCYTTQPATAGVGKDGCFWRCVGKGDGSKISGIKGGSGSCVANIGVSTGSGGPRGLIIESINGGSYRFENVFAIKLIGGHYDSDSSKNMRGEAHIEVVDAGVVLDTYMWHRGSVQIPTSGTFIQIEDLIAKQPSHVSLIHSFGAYNCEPRVAPDPGAGRDEANPDIFIKTAIEGTRITAIGNDYYSPNVGKTRSNDGCYIRAANPTLDAWLQSKKVLAFMAGDFEITCISASAARIRRPGGALQLVEAITNPVVTAVSASLGGDMGNTGPCLLTTPVTYAVCLDDGFDNTTKYQTTPLFTPNVLVNAAKLSISGSNSPCVARIWRSTTNAVTAPDKYIEIPLSGPFDMIDLGLSIAGYTWKNIGALPHVDAVADPVINGTFDGYAFGGKITSEQRLVKSADEDRVDGVYTGVTPDTELLMWCPAGTFKFLLELLYSATDTADLKWMITAPVGATGQLWQIGPNSTVSTAGGGSGLWISGDPGTTHVLGGAQPVGTPGGLTRMRAEVHARIFTPIPGLITFCWTKNASDANAAPARVFAGSALIRTRIS